eukprot:TRINITY_DN10214_c0_g1_i2.p1 TRINITY_DN10214_c0_g1~~TRINITY_DN10214_c0_g1_i2.p1  ORF type:complete len:1031 (+),score=110.12 TRINITY_DN10214_c0_g1_i2:842-3934(+)
MSSSQQRSACHAGAAPPAPRCANAAPMAPPSCLSARARPAVCTRGAATCLFDNFVRVAGRIIGALHGMQPLLLPAHIPPGLAAALGRIPPEDAAEGIAAIVAFSYEMKAPPGSPDQLPDRSRPSQLYRLLGCAMRSLGDPASRERLSAKQLEMWERVVEIMRPFFWRLDRILLALPHQPRIVYRGIDIRVSDNYKVGSIVLWPPVTSTSASRDVAWSFMSDDSSGTFFILLTLSIADISPFSWLPGEEEWLLHSLSVHKVTDVMQPGLRAIVGTNHDMVCLVQVDGRGARLSAAEMVRARALALRIQTLLFDGFLSTYVPPVVAVGHTAEGVAGAQGRHPLLGVVRQWCASDSRTVVLVGEGGCGKTATSLRLVRAAADERDPLPCPPGCGEPWLPLYVTLPVVPNLLTSGTGEGHAVRPLTDFIAHSNNLSPEELAEMQKLPVLMVLDGLEELPEGLSRLRGRGLLSAGGLDLEAWPNAKLVLCIRSEMLRRTHGCGRWKLTEHDVLPGADLWHVQDFGDDQIVEYSGKVIQREMLALAKAGVQTGPAWDADISLQRSVARLRCAAPPLDTVRDLQVAVRQLCAQGTCPSEAAEAVVEHSAAGAACREAMLAATAAVVARVRAADEGLVARPFILSMVVPVGNAVADTDFAAAPRRAIYGAWAEAEVRRRLPRIASLADRCPEFAAMDEDARVDLVINFCGALACSGLFIDVLPSFLLIARLHRYAPVAYVADLDLSPLGPEHNRTLLDAAPVRMETGKKAHLSFPHASVHDYFVADRVARLSALHSAEHQPDMQRVAVVLHRSMSLQEAVHEAQRYRESNPVGRLRRRISLFRWAQRAFFVVWSLYIFSGGVPPRWYHWLWRIASFGLVLQILLPRRLSWGKDVPWHYAACGVLFVALTVVHAMRMFHCSSSHKDPFMVDDVCMWYPVFGILNFLCLDVSLVMAALEPHLWIAAVGGLDLFEWPSLLFRRVLIGALLAAAGFQITKAALATEGWLDRVVELLFTVPFVTVACCILSMPARVRRRAAAV